MKRNQEIYVLTDVFNLNAKVAAGMIFKTLCKRFVYISRKSFKT